MGKASSWDDNVWLSVKETNDLLDEAGECSECGKPIVTAEARADVFFSLERGEQSLLEVDGWVRPLWGDCEDGHRNDLGD